MAWHSLNWKPQYFGMWDEGLDMLGSFAIKNHTELTQYNVLVAGYFQEGYEGDATVYMYKVAHHGKELGWMLELWRAGGGHCSCYGLEGQFEPERVSLAQLKMRYPEDKELDGYYWDDRESRSAMIEAVKGMIKHIESYLASPDGYPEAPIPEDEDA